MSYIILQFVQIVNIQQSMSCKRSYYTNEGLRKKRKTLICEQQFDEGDDILAGDTGFDIPLGNLQCRSSTNYHRF